jgi:hypothetical protein
MGLDVGLPAGGGDAPVEGDIESVQRGHPPVGPAGAALAGRLEAEHGQVENLQRGLLSGEMATSVDRATDLALRLSIALVVQMILRISGSNAGNGTISGQALVHNRMMAGYLRSHLVENSANASSAARSLEAV